MQDGSPDLTNLLTISMSFMILNYFLIYLLYSIVLNNMDVKIHSFARDSEGNVFNTAAFQSNGETRFPKVIEASKGNEQSLQVEISDNSECWQSSKAFDISCSGVHYAQVLQTGQVQKSPNNLGIYCRDARRTVSVVFCSSMCIRNSTKYTLLCLSSEGDISQGMRIAPGRIVPLPLRFYLSLRHTRIMLVKIGHISQISFRQRTLSFTGF